MYKNFVFFNKNTTINVISFFFFFKEGVKSIQEGRKKR